MQENKDLLSNNDDSKKMEENETEVRADAEETSNIVNSENTGDDYSKVNYENNDNWQFDAEASTLKDDYFDSINGMVVDSSDYDRKFGNKEITSSPESNYYYNQENSDQIVIRKDFLKFIPVALITLIVLIALIVLGVRYYTIPNGKEGELINPPAVAATIDGTKVSIGMYNWYYSSIVNYYEQRAMYGYENLDTEKSYDKQFTVDEDGNQITWSEFFENQTISEIKQNLVCYKKAKEEGISLSAKQKDDINTKIEKMKVAASDNGVFLDEYISEIFGDYCTESTVELMLKQNYMAMNYIGEYTLNSHPSESELDTYFNNNEEDFLQITFSYLAFSYDTTDDETKKQSQSVIDEYMDKITDRNSIIALVPTVYKDYIQTDVETAMASDSTLTEEEARENAIAEYYESIDKTLSYSLSPFSDEVTKWLFSDDTAVGSKNYYINEDTGYAYVILKTQEAVTDDRDSYSVRHILICPKSDDETTDSSSDVTYTDEQWKAAEDKANKILEEFNKGDKSEYSFAQLAEKYSEDTESTTAGSSGLYGGLYEGIAKGAMVSEFENWAFDSSRKYGDTGIVKSEYGYHIMFYINSGPMYKAQLAYDLRNYNLNEMIENAKVKLYDSVIDRAIELYNEAKKEEQQTNSSSDSSQSTLY